MPIITFTWVQKIRCSLVLLNIFSKSFRLCEIPYFQVPDVIIAWINIDVTEEIVVGEEATSECTSFSSLPHATAEESQQVLVVLPLCSLW